MWQIQRTLKRTWRIMTDFPIQEDWYDATGEYTSREGAITAATLHGDEYVFLRSEKQELEDAKYFQSRNKSKPTA